MKNLKNTLTVALVAAFTFFFTPVAKATDDSVGVPVELKYVGNIKNQPLMQLNFAGTKAENEFSILITDQNGFVLYSNDLRGEKFSQQFLLDTEDLGDAVLNFQITGRKSGKTVNYKVTSRSKTVHEMDVAKL